MKLEFNRIDDFYSTPKKEGELPKLLVKDLIYKVVLDTQFILPLNHINQKGKIVKSKCTIKYGEEYMILVHPYEYIKNLVLKNEIKEPIKVIGFNYKKRK